MSHSVLIVDDDPSSRMLLEEFLSEAGYEVRTAADCAEARAAATEAAPDLAIVDMNLPDGDGLTLLGELRGLTGHLPAFVLSGSEAEDVLRQCGISGVAIEGCITKPFSLAGILGLVAGVLDGGEA